VVKLYEMSASSPGEPSTTVPASLLNHNSHKAAPLIKSKGLSFDSSRKSLGRKTSIDEIEFEQCRLEPRCEGRILVFTDEVREQLDQERREFNESAPVDIIFEEAEDSV